VLQAIMDISARAISLAVRPQRAVGVTSARMRREDRSSISFLILSQTRAGGSRRINKARTCGSGGTDAGSARG
jgi:hypothetical protein